ncbi:MAG: prenyltransferase/squalene oxidase repeat-containing protein, partial [Promethearchaeota archaeon]
MTVIENKSAYPYITTFKKEPFKSFALIKKKDIGHFYFSEYDQVVKVYKYYNANLLRVGSLNIENIYWFLLLRKYLREDKKEHLEEIFKFISKCEVNLGDKIGFKFSPNSRQKYPDIWSTYFALASLKLLGVLKTYLSHKGKVDVRKAVLDFLASHKRNNGYLHCQDKECPIDKKTSTVRTLYFVLDALILLGIDVRANREEFRNIIGDFKREPTIVFKLLCSKFIETDFDVRDKEIQYLYQYQKENKGFSFKKIEGQINTTFWVVYALNNYSWILDYNPMGIYSFINSKFQEILVGELNSIRLMELSKLTILMSIIWEKFIQEIERVLFKQLEQDNYVDLNQIKNTFGLVHGIDEVISFINLNYTINLRILDNHVEFRNFIRNLSKGTQVIVQELYNRLKNNSIVSLTDILKKYKSSHLSENIKLREDIIPIVKKLTNRNFFKGTVRTKRSILKTKYLFYLNFFLEKIIVSDTEIH